MQKVSCDEDCNRNKMEVSGSISGEGEESDSTIEKGITKKPISYKRMLLGVDGEEDGYSSDPVESESDKEDSGEEMFQEDSILFDPLCPIISITTEERRKLCEPWRRAIIIKLLGRRIGYRILAGRLLKL